LRIQYYTRCSVYRKRRVAQPTTVAVMWLYIFFRTISKRDALPPHACMQLHGLRMRNRLACARRFWGRWLLFRIIIVSFLGPWNYIILYIIISDREETSYSSSRPLVEKYKKYPVLLFYPFIIRLCCTIFFVISCFMHAVNPAKLSRRFILYTFYYHCVYYNVYIILLLYGRIKANADAASSSLLIFQFDCVVVHNNSKYSEELL